MSDKEIARLKENIADIEKQISDGGDIGQLSSQLKKKKDALDYKIEMQTAGRLTVDDVKSRLNRKGVAKVAGKVAAKTLATVDPTNILSTAEQDFKIDKLDSLLKEISRKYNITDEKTNVFFRRLTELSTKFEEHIKNSKIIYPHP